MNRLHQVSSSSRRSVTELHSVLRRLIASKINKPEIDLISNNQSIPVPSNSGAPLRDTGAFVRWPNVYAAETHFRRALKSTRTIKIDESIKNNRACERKYSAQMLDGLMKGLTKPISDVLQLHEKKFRNLHPFESTVANLTVIARKKSGHPDLKDILTDLRTLRATTSKIGKEFASLASNAASAQEAKDLMKNGFDSLENYYNTSREAQGLSDITEMHKALRSIPVIHLHLPTIVLVGAPNVGKSSIVRAVSSGTPEVNDYPFTTRGVTIGHIFDASLGEKFQVMDTPGLLDRPDEERNEMERLTFASLAHLPTAVIFVIDPTGTSGAKSNITAQLNVRKYLKSRFPQRPWIDVLSKGDKPMSEEILTQLDFEYLSVSVHTGMNISELQSKIVDLLYHLRNLLEARKRQEALKLSEKQIK